ncbi:MAG: enoyl-CoA hydratase/isomerase family protein [Methanobacteriota archaeon]|nr:MAG: enoyl-CoA hydratase/isomerase family protein [Euryarchaeota archaeon]
MAYETILLERRGPVAILRFNRPDKLNAMNSKMKDEIISALDDLEADDAIRVAVLTGAGDKAFVAGADINEFKDRSSIEQWDLYQEPFLYGAVDRFKKPVIAMINGYCLGGGCELALACDMRIASERAQIGQPEINIGIIPGGGGTQRLPRVVPLGKAMELILTGDRISAAEAHRIGLLDEVTAHDQLEARTMEIANRIADKSPVAVRLAKQAVKASTRMGLDAGLRYEQSLFALVFATHDKEEGVRAFLEKRPPRWTGT